MLVRRHGALSTRPGAAGSDPQRVGARARCNNISLRCVLAGLTFRSDFYTTSNVFTDHARPSPSTASPASARLSDAVRRRHARPCGRPACHVAARAAGADIRDREPARRHRPDRRHHAVERRRAHAPPGRFARRNARRPARRVDHDLRADGRPADHPRHGRRPDPAAAERRRRLRCVVAVVRPCGAGGPAVDRAHRDRARAGRAAVRR